MHIGSKPDEIDVVVGKWKFEKRVIERAQPMPFQGMIRATRRLCGNALSPNRDHSTFTLTPSLLPLSSTTTTWCTPRVGRRNILRDASPLAMSVPSSNQ